MKKISFLFLLLFLPARIVRADTAYTQSRSAEGDANMDPTLSNDFAKLVGRKVGDALREFGATLDQAREHSEPPGKLKAISFQAAPPSRPALVCLFVKYDGRIVGVPAGARRNNAILNMDVIGLTVQQGDRVQDFGEISVERIRAGVFGRRPEELGD
jgi:hypothetical protein